MADGGYWVRLSAGDRELGAGFLVTRRYVLTAAHCLRGLPDDVSLTATPTAGEPLRARIEQVATEVDLALVELRDAAHPDNYPPMAGRCGSTDAWFGPYRPSHADPHLRGSVTHHRVDYKCEGGAMIPALQLSTDVELGDYRGYSGGPVERADAGHRERIMLGMLLEQYPDRATPDRNTNVLFAAAIGEALSHFDAFAVGHLLEVLAAEGSDCDLAPARASVGVAADAPIGSEVAATAARVARTDILLDALHDWSVRGLLEPGEVKMLRVQVLRSLIDE
jgi:hypothetical protein